MLRSRLCVPPAPCSQDFEAVCEVLDHVDQAGGDGWEDLCDARGGGVTIQENLLVSIPPRSPPTRGESSSPAISRVAPLKTRTARCGHCRAAGCGSAPAPAAGNTADTRGSAGRTRAGNPPRCTGSSVHSPSGALRRRQVRDAARHRRMIGLAGRHQAEHAPRRSGSACFPCSGRAARRRSFPRPRPSRRRRAAPRPASPPRARTAGSSRGTPAAFSAHSTDHVP